MASVKIFDNTANVENDLRLKASIFLRTATEEVVNIATPNTPKKTGRLRADVVKQVLGLRGKIIWGKNYAVFQEKKQFRNYTTPGTGPHYAENAIKAMISDTAKVARRAGLIK